MSMNMKPVVIFSCYVIFHDEKVLNVCMCNGSCVIACYLLVICS